MYFKIIRYTLLIIIMAGMPVLVYGSSSSSSSSSNSSKNADEKNKKSNPDRTALQAVQVPATHQSALAKNLPSQKEIDDFLALYNDNDIEISLRNMFAYLSNHYIRLEKKCETAIVIALLQELEKHDQTVFGNLLNCEFPFCGSLLHVAIRSNDSLDLIRFLAPYNTEAMRHFDESSEGMFPVVMEAILYAKERNQTDLIPIVKCLLENLPNAGNVKFRGKSTFLVALNSMQELKNGQEFIELLLEYNVHVDFDVTKLGAKLKARIPKKLYEQIKAIYTLQILFNNIKEWSIDVIYSVINKSIVLLDGKSQNFLYLLFKDLKKQDLQLFNQLCAYVDSKTGATLLIMAGSFGSFALAKLLLESNSTNMAHCDKNGHDVLLVLLGYNFHNSIIVRRNCDDIKFILELILEKNPSMVKNQYRVIEFSENKILANPLLLAMQTLEPDLVECLLQYDCGLLVKDHISDFNRNYPRVAKMLSFPDKELRKDRIIKMVEDAIGKIKIKIHSSNKVTTIKAVHEACTAVLNDLNTAIKHESEIKKQQEEQEKLAKKKAQCDEEKAQNDKDNAQKIDLNMQVNKLEKTLSVALTPIDLKQPKSYFGNKIKRLKQKIKQKEKSDAQKKVADQENRKRFESLGFDSRYPSDISHEKIKEVLDAYDKQALLKKAQGAAAANNKDEEDADSTTKIVPPASRLALQNTKDSFEKSKKSYQKKKKNKKKNTTASTSSSSAYPKGVADSSSAAAKAAQATLVSVRENSSKSSQKSNQDSIISIRNQFDRNEKRIKEVLENNDKTQLKNMKQEYDDLIIRCSLLGSVPDQLNSIKSGSCARIAQITRQLQNIMTGPALQIEGTPAIEGATDK